jgi:hypothetical protein
MNIEIAPKEYEIRSSWDDARLYCFALTIDGKTGWRLPTVKELNSSWAMPGCDFARWYYWSCEEGDIGYAIDVDFNRQGLDYKSSPENKGYDDNLVRPVRDLKDD